ncbi:hypothetical protein [Actomonas aquatica]|uniref:Uncharacterized protein n=1 Tax=Actomonas aquatica TaxID=2866162 RepID=A0ABZ1CHQ2_9BACT|nr:hypothetical protein [Opitutus sp. WL0086]WRQ89790.1 hypothetical protein K1X11_010270 [Opitutus sp. WL0086]
MARLTPEQLEQKIHAVLREQPPRRAPMSLESRVLGEIARRQALPWWHKSYAYWPQPMRLTFLVIACGLAAAAVLGSMHLAGLFSAAAITSFFEPITSAVATLRAAGSSLGELVRPLVPTISTQWLYVALAVIGASYALLVGVGATAYRFLWHPQR